MVDLDGTTDDATSTTADRLTSRPHSLPLKLKLNLGSALRLTSITNVPIFPSNPSRLLSALGRLATVVSSLGVLVQVLVSVQRPEKCKNILLMDLLSVSPSLCLSQASSGRATSPGFF
ncbi:hypothetical protein GJ744_009737 [Endocarpon pusillum]|uniref:Uncharacterized protein n=1 Tax=Endocarpon pusillum TaxID=364733 RepID=A0A8H7AUB8_9EURO|nr:hypothetical protein GJ744_009737 [Endocarpon pusillum]